MIHMPDPRMEEVGTDGPVEWVGDHLVPISILRKSPETVLHVVQPISRIGRITRR